LLSGASVLFLAACSNPGKSAAPVTADTSGSTSGGTTPLPEALKVAQLGVATPDRLAQIGDYAGLVEEFTLKAEYVTSAEEVIKTQEYLNHAQLFAGTTTAELDSFKTKSSDEYFLYIARYDKPAAEAELGAAPTGEGGMVPRHRSVASRALQKREYSQGKENPYAVEETTSDIVITKGTFASGAFTATFKTSMKDNIAGSQADINDHSNNSSINGYDTVEANYTLKGNKWTCDVTSSTYTADGSSK
jgi:hypothetical protein